MKRIITSFLVVAMIIVLAGCSFSLPFLSKPEDVVDEFMTQEVLMDLLAQMDDFIIVEDFEDYGSIFWSKILTSASMKSLLLDNVRSISYTITDVSTNGNSSKVTALITHYDMSPIVDRAIEIFIDRVEEMDNSGMEVPESEDETVELLLNVATQCFKEAISKTKPAETYTKIRFDCEKGSSGVWELREMPDEFIDKVLLMNIESAFDDGWKNYDIYSLG